MPTEIKSVDRHGSRIIVSLSNGRDLEFGSWGEMREHIDQRFGAIDDDELSILFSLKRWVEKHPDGADGKSDGELLKLAVAIDFKAADADIVKAIPVKVVDDVEGVTHG